VAELRKQTASDLGAAAPMKWDERIPNASLGLKSNVREARKRTMINKSNNPCMTLSMNNAALLRIRRRTLIVRAWIVFSLLSFAGLVIVVSRFL
jgi:hypothetical protein